MKWFFALNQACATYDFYGEMIMVAVRSARRHTRLQPHLLHDGDETWLTRWLRAQGAAVLTQRSRFYPILEDLAIRAGDPGLLQVGAGAFLRAEIPHLQLPDEVVLYTDCDVMFTGEVSALDALRPRFFAVAPESQPRNWDDLNSGVMLMNLPALRADAERFEAATAARLPELARTRTWDQEAYRRFYGRRGLRRARWDRLPLEYNWKPYWGANPDARIVHFHGPKPFQRELLDRSDPLPSILRQRDVPAFRAYCALWDEERAQLPPVRAGMDTPRLAR